MSNTIFDLHAKVSADASPFNKAMDSTASSVTSSLGAIQSAAHTFIGNGVVQAFTRAVNVANEFGQIIADISSISDLNMQHLSNSIRNMENVYGKASRIGNTVYEAISSGIEGTEDEYVKFAKVVGQTSKSIRADIETTGNVLTTLSNAYGMSVSEVSKLADMLFVTVREGKAQGNQLAHTLGLVTNTAAEAGVSLAEMSAVISILSRTQSASQSMIAFNQMLNGLIKPTQEAQREAKKWGIEIGATALQTKGLTAILTEMHDKIGGNVEAINAILGNIRAMRAGTALTGKQFQNFLSVLHTAEKEIGTGVAFEAFTKQTNTAQQALENFETQVDKTSITVGKDFEPITRHLSEFAEIFLRTFGSGEGWSLGGIGRVGAYITGIGLVIKGVVSSVKLLKNFSTSMVRDGNNLTSSSNTFATNVERAQRALQLSNAAITSINTRMSASALPNQYRMEQRALHPSPAMIKAQAQANLNAMYLRNSKGALYDPSTGRLVSERKLLAEETARLTKAYKLERTTILNQVRRDSALQRYNRRFGTNYGSYDALRGTGRLGREWKVLGARVSKGLTKLGARVSKGLTKLGAGLLNAGMMVASWETGWAIGTAIREKFGTDDMFISDKSKRDAEIAEMENTAIVRKSTMRLTEQLYNRKLIDAAEYARLNAEIALTSTIDETMVLYKTLQDKLNKSIAEVPSKPKTSTELVKEAKDAYNKDVKSINDKYNKGERDATGTEIAKADKMLLQLLSSKENTLLNSEDSRVAVMQLFKSGFHSQQKRDEVATALVNAFMKKQDELIRQDYVYAAASRGSNSEKTYNKVSAEDVYKRVYSIMDKLATVRQGDADTKEMRNAEIRNAYVARHQEAIRGAFASHEDKIASKDTAIKQYTSALSTPNSSALDVTEIDTAIDNYNSRLKTFNNIRDTIAKVVKEAKQEHKSDKTIDTITAEGRQKLGNMLTELDALEKGIQASVNAVIDKNAKDISNIAQELKGKGLKEGSEKFTAAMVKAISERIASVNKRMTNSKSTVEKGYYTKIAEDLEKQKKDIYEAKFKTLSDENEALFKAGGITEAQHKRFQHAILQDRKNKGLYKGSEMQYDAEVLASFYAIRDADLNEIKDKNDKRAKRRSVLRDTGRLSEEKAAKQEASDALKIINAINRQLGAEKKYLKGNLSDTERNVATKRVKDLTERRTEYRGIRAKALLKAEDAVLKFRTGLLSTIKGFADMRNGVKMTNDALWHSVNLASRMSGIPRSKPYMVETTAIPNRYKADRMRKQAQGAVSASVDSWIMSQKYAEANVGKTVTDIFKFMQQNNTIVVRKQ